MQVHIIHTISQSVHTSTFMTRAHIILVHTRNYIIQVNHFCHALHPPYNMTSVVPNLFLGAILVFFRLLMVARCLPIVSVALLSEGCVVLLVQAAIII